MTLMKQLASADFRKQYTAQSEPVEVTAHGKVIGTWIPKGSTIEVPPMDLPAPAEPEAETRMTIRPVHPGVKKVVPVGERRVIDPLDSARAERTGYSRFHNRMYGKSKGGKD